MYKSKILKRTKSGDLILEVSFDIMNQDHELGEEKRYILEEVTNTIRNPTTQHHINSGYCLGYLGHSGRNSKKGAISTEKNDLGETVEPSIKTLMLKIKGNTVTHQQLIINTEIGRKVMKFIDSGIGGFSFAWRPDLGIFAGADYVYTPNFNGNRIIEGSVCNGTCDPTNIAKQMALDEVKENPKLSLDEVQSFIRDSRELKIIERLQVNSKKEIKLLTDEIAELKRESLKTKKILRGKGIELTTDGISFKHDAIGSLLRGADLPKSKYIHEELEIVRLELPQEQKEVKNRSVIEGSYFGI